MKKLLFALPAILLSVFIAGCSKNPDDELAEKIPATANTFSLIDGNAIVQTNLYKKYQKDIREFLKKASLSEDVFQCRLLSFGFTKEEWVGVLLQSQNGQAKKIFDLLLSKAKEEKKLQLKETKEKDEIRVTTTFEGKPVLAILYHENLMLVSIGQSDPAFFQAKSANPVFKQLTLKNTLISAVGKVEFPQQGKAKEVVDAALQMVPALKKIQFLFLNVPYEPGKQADVDLRLVCEDDAGANELLATVNMGLGFLTQSKDPEALRLVNLIKRKTEKNVIVISFPVEEVFKFLEEPLIIAGVKKKSIGSASNLKQIALGCLTFACDHHDKFPNDLNELVKGNYLTDLKVYIAPIDERRQISKDKVIRPANTSYAYVGKGFTLTKIAYPSRLPFAFEKPDVVAKHRGECNVAFVDGHVETLKVKGKTCKAIAEELTAKLAPDNANAKDFAIVIANAAAEDLAE